MKESLTANEISELTDTIQNHAFLSMTIKKDYWSDHPRLTFCPIIRVQSKTDLAKLQQKYGGSLYKQPTAFEYQIPKQFWTWSIKMLRTYLPLILKDLGGKTRTKAELILKALSYMHGRGKPQDTEKLKEIYMELKKLQEPRPRYVYPWDNDRMSFT